MCQLWTTEPIVEYNCLQLTEAAKKSLVKLIKVIKINMLRSSQFTIKLTSSSTKHFTCYKPGEIN